MHKIEKPDTARRRFKFCKPVAIDSPICQKKLVLFYDKLDNTISYTRKNAHNL